MSLTAKHLRELLHYDQSTGVFTWLVSRSGAVKLGDVAGTPLNGYIRIKVGGVRTMAQRLAWLYMTGEWPKQRIDHKNGQRSDNAWINLREGSNAFNMENQRRARSDNTTGFLGVKINKNGFAAKICVQGKHIWLGTYQTPEVAHQVYLKAKRTMHKGCTI